MAVAGVMRVPVDGPFEWDAMLRYFAPRAIRGVEYVDGDVYRRVVGAGQLVVRATRGGHLSVSGSGRPRVRRLFGLDAAHADAVAALRRAPIVGQRVRRARGLRVPGTYDPFETGVRAIVGQQVSVAGASTVTARIVARHGTPVAGLGAGLTHAFPGSAVLADADLDGLGLTGGRITAIRGFAAAVADGSIVLDGTPSLDELVAAITAVRGLGPWTAHYLALRTGYADAFPVADLGLQRTAGLDAKALATAAQQWRPYRALAAVHLWETP